LKFDKSVDSKSYVGNPGFTDDVLKLNNGEIMVKLLVLIDLWENVVAE